MDVPAGFDTDVLVVGAGIAGASLAAAIAPTRATLLIEAEDMPGRHSTGRSAAFWHETYGGPLIQPLSRASFATLSSPPPAFAESSFLRPRAALTIATEAERGDLDAYVATFRGQGVAVERVDHAAMAALVPGLRAAWSAGAHEALCSDIDVAALHAAYLAAARRAGASLRTRAPLHRARWTDGGWSVDLGGTSLRARVIVNAAGAWADDVAGACDLMPLGIQPYRRTIAQLRLGTLTSADIPLVIHVNGDFYFKGEGEGRVWLSPHDETPDMAHDVAPEELDVALAIDRFQSVVDWPIAAVERKWAGLRSFAPDRLPVLGPDPDQPAFVWCAGQGGFGIQTAPAAAALTASWLGAPLTPDFAELDRAAYAPDRLRG